MNRRLQRRIAEDNHHTVRLLVEQLRSPLGVIPFVGAGMSAAFGFPQWADLIRKAARKLTSRDKQSVNALLAKQDFAAAATRVVASLGQERFQDAVAEESGDYRVTDAQLSHGALALLPLISQGPVITTNLDRNLERAYAAAARPFLQRVYGANPSEVVPALQRNERVLWKIHGDWKDPRTQVLTDIEYKQRYSRHEQLGALLGLAFTNRPILFLGASLTTDYTVQVLARIARDHPRMRQFTITSAPDTDEKFEKRSDQLARIGVTPLWYIKDHGLVEAHLSALLQKMAASTLQAPVRKRAPISGTDEYRTAISLLKRELRRLPKPLPCLDAPPYTPLAERIFRGEIVFYLGAGACLDRLPLGREFYDRLSAKFDASIRGLERTQIAQHFTDVYGREDLYAQVNQFLGDVRAAPTAVHRLLASLPSRLREKGFRTPPLLIFTTNYDDWMERALDQAGEPYHVFLYRAGEPYRGTFVHFDPCGNVQVVDNPAAFHRLPEDHTILVKYHGGHSPRSSLPVSYLFTQRDFIELAGAVPGSIPKALIGRLEQSSLLFLGHGLGEGSTEALVRAAHKNRCAKVSWAVQWMRPAQDGAIPDVSVWQPTRRYWKAVGVELIVCPLERFIPELDRSIEDHPKANLK